jgi:hypothetical protein
MKVKQLIKKLSELDPEANVYLGEGPLITVHPARFAHYGLYLKKDRIFILKKWAETPGGMYSDQQYMGRLLEKNKMTAPNFKDVFLSSWDGEFGDD